MKRRNKKQEYLNGLDYDIKYLQEEIQKGVFPFWWLGDKMYKWNARLRLNELLAEQTKIALEPDYKPWKDSIYA